MTLLIFNYKIMFNSQQKTFMRKRRIIFPFLLLVSFLVLSAIVMILWNEIFTDVLKANKISYLQSAGLLLLCRILFGSFGFGRRGGGHFRGPGHLKDKWASMSDEEKIKFRDEWKKRCAERKR
jgi:hypothetical protein